MSGNIDILYKNLERLARMKNDIDHSVGKLFGPLQKIQNSDISELTLEERETVAAFIKRFRDYRNQLGTMMRIIAMEEKSLTSPFGAVLALMEKLEVLDSAEKWKSIRELCEHASHEYVFQNLSGMVEGATYLVALHVKIQTFVISRYSGS